MSTREHEHSTSDRSGVFALRDREGYLNFSDVWNVLMRRRWVFLGTFLSVLAISVLISVLTTPVYESRATIEIGRIADVGVIEKPAITIRRLKEQYRIGDANSVADYPKLWSVERGGGAEEDLIFIRARAFQSQGAQGFLRSVCSELLNRHQALWNATQERRMAHITQLDREIDLLEAQVHSLRPLTEGLEDRAQAAVVAVERGSLLSSLANLRDEQAENTLIMSPVQSYRTRLIKEPTLPTEPAKPRFLLYLVLGVLLGLVLAVFNSFFVESVIAK